MVTKKIICITGANYSDGMGDIAHILNIGSSLQKSFPNYEIVYHIQWDSREDIDNIGRLEQLLSLLKKHNIIQKNVSIKFDSYEEYLEAIDNIDRHKFSIYDTSPNLKNGFKKYLQNYVVKYKEKTSRIDHFIMVSAPVHNRSNGRSVFFNNKRVLYILEHNGFLQGVDHEDVFGDQDHVFRMGFSRAEHGCRHPKSTDVGILLEDNTQISETEQQEALMQIKNKKFNALLFCETVPTPSDTAIFLKTLKKTLFVPTYLIHGAPTEHFIRILTALKECLPNDERDIFLQGRSFKIELLFTEPIKSQLQSLGITKIEYMDNINDRVKTVELKNENEKEKVLKILNKVYLDDNDYDLLNKKLSTIFIGCSGDNSLQDAISRGAIPIFFPHNTFKKNTILELKNLLLRLIKGQKRVGKELNWKACLDFLSVDHPIFTPELVTQWKEVCTCLIQNYNTHDLIKERVIDYINANQSALPIQPSSSALLALLKEESRFGESALHGTATIPKSLRAILEFLLPNDRLAAVSIKDKNGNSVLDLASAVPESLQQIRDLLPLEDRLKILTKENKNSSDDSEPIASIVNPESRNAIVALLPPEEQLEMSKAEDHALLFRAAQIPGALEEILTFFPQEKRLNIIRAKNADGDSILDLIACFHDPSQLFTKLVDLLPKDMDMLSDLENELAIASEKMEQQSAQNTELQWEAGKDAVETDPSKENPNKLKRF